ncbi:MAG: glutaredoxin domain-containing protein [Chloroflexota bacterium]|nr:glutaredoxin domain-containing protein [Chloroflexota bacterium]
MKTEKRQPRVIVFSTPTCPHCKHAKSYLQKNNIQFKDIDVSRDHAAARDMMRRSGRQGVPQIDINGRIIVGFNRRKLDQLLGL